MKLTGLHILLTYQCNFECDHCFVWGSPWQSGTFTMSQLEDVLTQAEQVGTVTSIYFEGGEPFLYYPVLLEAVNSAVDKGFQVGMVSNGYWATTKEDALIWLQPLAGKLVDLSVSSDLFHYDEALSRQARNASQAAEELGIPIGTISIAHPETGEMDAVKGQLPLDESGVMYRGRAAEKLVRHAALNPWVEFTACPYEDLVEPGRIHLDPLGNLHICQGISIGNLFQRPLIDICSSYEPENHAVVGPLLSGGPAELARVYGLEVNEAYADACHLCYSARLALRERLPDLLVPDQVYGKF
ncbi:MAG: radical SAM protein [Anaerolineales bacterium]